jgi:hypothetical protein
MHAHAPRTCTHMLPEHEPWVPTMAPCTVYVVQAPLPATESWPGDRSVAALLAAEARPGDIAFDISAPTLSLRLSLPPPSSITVASLAEVEAGSMLHARMVRGKCRDTPPANTAVVLLRVIMWSQPFMVLTTMGMMAAHSACDWRVRLGMHSACSRHTLRTHKVRACRRLSQHTACTQHATRHTLEALDTHSKA